MPLTDSDTDTPELFLIRGFGSMLNRTLDEFEVGELIATGTAGKIYEAVEKKTQIAVAIKILPADVSRDQNIYIRFEREMVILGKLDHPNIVKFFGGGKNEESLFYAMERVQGGTLRQLIDKHHGLTWHETVKYGIRICSALQYLHNHGIVHRDVKPSNIFITFEGEIKLGDFGIAFDSTETELTETGLIVGSYAYMAPEQIRGDHGTDASADLYSLGCVLYEMLSGHAPYRGDTFAKIFDQHLNSSIPQLSESVKDVPPSLDNLVARLMAKERSQRPFNARAVQGVLSELKYRWEEDEKVYQEELTRREEAFHPSTVTIAPPEVTWHKFVILLSVLILIILMAAFLANLN